ncbi:reverse transcriptase-like protein, partial [Corynebacterium parakroppenstedtii]|uniref:reverse transcriptase-like protein n=1 Tax=Corynebacterium parakroppenstedtii TaxID=2828363 RepID=UPI003BB531C9
MGLEMLIGLQAHAVDIFGDSQLVINQVKGIFKCQSASMLPYYVVALHLLSQFQIENVTYIPRFMNNKANDVVQKASLTFLQTRHCVRPTLFRYHFLLLLLKVNQSLRPRP